MASHFVSIPRGLDGEKYSDFTTGAASSAVVNGIELRIDDANALRAADVDKLILALRRFFQNADQWQPAGFVIGP